MRCCHGSINFKNQRAGTRASPSRIPSPSANTAGQAAKYPPQATRPKTPAKYRNCLPMSPQAVLAPTAGTLSVPAVSSASGKQQFCVCFNKTSFNARKPTRSVADKLANRAGLDMAPHAICMWVLQPDSEKSVRGPNTPSVSGKGD
jgi:hypothetical protein